VAVAEDRADLGGGKALLGELADQLGGLLIGGLLPGGRTATIRDRRAGDTLSKQISDYLDALPRSVHTTHLA